MNEKVVCAGPGAASVTSIAALSTLIALAIFGAVTALFQSRGLPMEALAAAERACSAHVYVSERESCMRERIALARGERIARK